MSDVDAYKASCVPAEVRFFDFTNCCCFALTVSAGLGLSTGKYNSRGSDLYFAGQDFLLPEG